MGHKVDAADLLPRDIEEAIIDGGDDCIRVVGPSRIVEERDG